MNINKFTQKSMEAVQNCEKLAYEHGNQQLEQEHLLYSLLTLEEARNIAGSKLVRWYGRTVGRG